MTIDTALVSQFSDNFRELYQQKGYKLRPYVDIKFGARGEKIYFDYINTDTQDPTAITERGQDTPLSNAEFTRRMCSPVSYADAKLIDDADVGRMLADPRSPIQMQTINKFGRFTDQLLLRASTGVAYYGKNGGSSVSLPSSQIVDNGTSLSLTDLLDAKKIFDNNDVPDEDRVITFSGSDLHGLLQEDKLTSADYNSVKALVNGQIDTFLGFKFIRLSKSLFETTSTKRSLVALHRGALGLCIIKDITIKVDQLSTKNYSTQVYVCMDLGASRLIEEGVVVIKVLK